MADIEKAIKAYRDLRDKKSELAEKHKEEMSPITKKMWDLEVWLLATLNKMGVNSMKTDAGTVFKKTSTSVKVTDWPAVLELIKEHDLWHMLEHRLSKAAVEEYIEAEGTAPPGVAIETQVGVNIRK